MANHSALNEKPPSRGGPPESDVASPRLGRITAIVAIVVVAFIALGLTGYVEKWLWMRQLDYVGIFWTVLSVRCAMGVLAFVIVFGFLWRNLREAVKAAAVHRGAVQPWGCAPELRNDASAEADIKFLGSDPVAP